MLAALFARPAELAEARRLKRPFDKLRRSKLKEALRGAKARTYEALDAALAEAWESVTASDAEGWFTHCGYPI